MPDSKPPRTVPSFKGDGPEVVGAGRECKVCKAKLNRYNKHEVCGPCRNKMRGGGPPLTMGQIKKMSGGK